MGDRRLATTRRERELRQLSDALRAGDADVPNEGIHSRALLDAASLSSGQRVEARAKRSEIWRPAEVHKKQKGQRASTVRVASSVGRFLVCHSTAQPCPHPHLPSPLLKPQSCATLVVFFQHAAGHSNFSLAPPTLYERQHHPPPRHLAARDHP